MKKNISLPTAIPVFPLSNFIIFPETTVPLNIFEPRYIQMINDTMKNNNLIGIVQPKKNESKSIPKLYNIGCMGKITSLNETEDGRYSIILNGISRFKILDEVKNDKLYRECKISFGEFKDDIELQESKIKISDLEIIFRDLKNLFKKRGYVINWEELKKQNINQTINNLSMASPFSLEEKQALLETKDIFSRKNKFEEILKTYVLDNFSNTTIQ
jgi:Lon protease-like protein